MKRFLVLLLCMATLQAVANPLPVPPSAMISELYFDSNGKWMIEIELFGARDTIRLLTDAGTSYYVIKGDPYEEHFLVLTSDSLSNPLVINKQNDRIKVLSRSMFDLEGFEYDSLLVGNRFGSQIDSIPPGCSINKSWWINNICLDRSPTIGFQNDEDGTTGSIYGHFYKMDPYVVQYDSTYFYFIDQVFMSTDLWTVGIPINKNCDFSAKVKARKYELDKLLIFTYSTNDVYQLDFVKQYFSVYPGDSIRVDFTLETALKTAARRTPLFSNFPNPANEQTTFVFDMPINASDKVTIKLYTMEGALLKTWKPVSGMLNVDCKEMKPGTYICTMESAGILRASTKLLIVR